MKISYFRDGGSFGFTVDGVQYSIDHRTGTTTKGSVYTGRHPSEGVLSSSADMTLIIEECLDHMTDKYIFRVQRYRDGGSILFTVNGVNYCIDKRIGTKTPGSVYVSHPSNGFLATKEDLTDIVNFLIERIHLYNFNLSLSLHEIN